VSLIIPAVVGINEKLLEVETNLTTATAKHLCIKLKQSVIKRLFVYEQRTTPKAATLLDPRLKAFAFRNSENASQGREYLQKEVSKLLSKHTDFQSSHTVQVQHSDDVDEREPSPCTSKCSSGIFDFVSQRINQANRHSTKTSDAIILLRQYMESDAIDFASNPILYWEQQSKQFKELGILATRFLSVSATSVPSERIFSKAGQIISNRRANLKSKNANFLIFFESKPLPFLKCVYTEIFRLLLF
jgi:hypothetical protein